jgi:hypothetical protein
MAGFFGAGNLNGRDTSPNFPTEKGIGTNLRKSWRAGRIEVGWLRTGTPRNTSGLAAPLLKGPCPLLASSPSRRPRKPPNASGPSRLRQIGELPGLFDTRGHHAGKLLADVRSRPGGVDPKLFKEAPARTKHCAGVSGTISSQANREAVKEPPSLSSSRATNSRFILKAEVPVKMD